MPPAPPPQSAPTAPSQQIREDFFAFLRASVPPPLFDRNADRFYDLYTCLLPHAEPAMNAGGAAFRAVLCARVNKSGAPPRLTRTRTHGSADLYARRLEHHLNRSVPA
jgi:hypothetical protein